MKEYFVDVIQNVTVFIGYIQFIIPVYVFGSEFWELRA